MTLPVDANRHRIPVLPEREAARPHRRVRPRAPYLVLWFLVVATAVVLAFSDTVFDARLLVVTLLSMTLAMIALMLAARGPFRILLQFSLLVVVLVYPIKALYVAIVDALGLDDLVILPLRYGIDPDAYSEAVVSSSLLVAALSIVILATREPATAPRCRARIGPVRGKMTVLVALALFLATTILRLHPIDDGLLRSLNYVLNHRAFPFLMSFVTVVFLVQGQERKARVLFTLWLCCSALQFVLFGSKSYLFLPIVVYVLAVYAFKFDFCNRYIAVIALIALVLIYPVFNIYRSVVVHSGGGLSEVLAVYSEIYLGTPGQASASTGSVPGWLSAPVVWINPVFERFVGFEWYLSIIQRARLGLLPVGWSFTEGLSSFNEIMHVYVLLKEQEDGVGIAPSLMGQSFIATHAIYGSAILSAGVVIVMICCFQSIALLLPDHRFALIAPSAIILFSHLTDGNLFALYWDVPSLIMVCLIGRLVVRPSR